MTIKIEESPGFTINRTAYLMRRAFVEASHDAGFDLTPEEFIVLSLLWRADGLRQGELAEYAIRDRTTLTRLLDGMERKRLVRRRPDPEDRRAVCAWLTAKGRRIEKEFKPFYLRIERLVYDGITKKERQRIMNALHQIQENLQDGLF